MLWLTRALLFFFFWFHSFSITPSRIFYQYRATKCKSLRKPKHQEETHCLSRSILDFKYINWMRHTAVNQAQHSKQLSKRPTRTVINGMKTYIVRFHFGSQFEDVWFECGILEHLVKCSLILKYKQWKLKTKIQI